MKLGSRAPPKRQHSVLCVHDWLFLGPVQSVGLWLPFSGEEINHFMKVVLPVTLVSEGSSHTSCRIAELAKSASLSPSELAWGGEETSSVCLHWGPGKMQVAVHSSWSVASGPPTSPWNPSGFCGPTPGGGGCLELLFSGKRQASSAIGGLMAL